MIFELVRTIVHWPYWYFYIHVFGVGPSISSKSSILISPLLTSLAGIDKYGKLGLVEETIFRGQLLPALRTHWSSLPVGFVFSTLLFAALHVNPFSLFKGGKGFKDAVVLIAYQLVTGSIFAALFVLTNNLAVPIDVLHLTFLQLLLLAYRVL